MAVGPLVIGFDGTSSSARLIREAGLDADTLSVAEDPEVTAAETLVRLARERGAQAMAVGPHDHGHGARPVLGSTSRDVIRHAPCPVVVASRASS